MNYVLTTNQNELKHYGVLGMKWGIRRASRKGETYTYKSHGQKKYEKKVANSQKKYDKKLAKGKDSTKLKSKIEENKSKLDVYKERDKYRQDYASEATLGKSIVKQLVLGPIKAGSYNRYRAAGESTVDALVKTAIIGAFDPTLGIAGAVISRGTEKSRAKDRVKLRKEYGK